MLIRAGAEQRRPPAECGDRASPQEYVTQQSMWGFFPNQDFTSQNVTVPH